MVLVPPEHHRSATAVYKYTRSLQTVDNTERQPHAPTVSFSYRQQQQFHAAEEVHRLNMLHEDTVASRIGGQHHATHLNRRAQEERNKCMHHTKSWQILASDSAAWAQLKRASLRHNVADVRGLAPPENFEILYRRSCILRHILRGNKLYNVSELLFIFHTHCYDQYKTITVSELIIKNNKYF